MYTTGLISSKYSTGGKLPFQIVQYNCLHVPATWNNLKSTRISMKVEKILKVQNESVFV